MVSLSTHKNKQKTQMSPPGLPVLMLAAKSGRGPFERGRRRINFRRMLQNYYPQSSSKQPRQTKKGPSGAQRPQKKSRFDFVMNLRTEGEAVRKLRPSEEAQDGAEASAVGLPGSRVASGSPAPFFAQMSVPACVCEPPWR